MRYEYDPFYDLEDRIRGILKTTFGANTTTGEMTFLDANERVSVDAMGIRRDISRLIILVGTCSQITKQDISRLGDKMKRFARQSGVYQSWPIEGLIVCESAAGNDVKLANKQHIVVAEISEKSTTILNNT